MKFTPPEDECNAEREFEVYTYLESINQTDKEAYGIPTVYYYGRWEGCVLMAITLLDKLKNYQMNSMDILIIFREFVSFMHRSRSGLPSHLIQYPIYFTYKYLKFS